MKTLDDTKLPDAGAERVRRSHHDAIREIQDLPASSTRIIPNVELPDGVGVQVAHRLGRRPKMVIPSAPRGAATGGVIQDFLDKTTSGGPNDRSRTLSLRATGFGGTITVDIEVK